MRLSLILIGSVFKMIKTYLQLFLEVNKNAIKDDKMTNFIDKELEPNSSDNDSDKSDAEQYIGCGYIIIKSIKWFCKKSKDCGLRYIQL